MRLPARRRLPSWAAAPTSFSAPRPSDCRWNLRGDMLSCATTVSSLLSLRRFGGAGFSFVEKFFIWSVGSGVESSAIYSEVLCCRVLPSIMQSSGSAGNFRV
ncbi:exported hypothetical protein [Candidatus Sulfopaludibacter sp. SbA4]|nr:exported hypothetical protein [Candidatus Sulfopaludibacter sp. SbA4]